MFRCRLIFGLMLLGCVLLASGCGKKELTSAPIASKGKHDDSAYRERDLANQGRNDLSGRQLSDRQSQKGKWPAEVQEALKMVVHFNYDSFTMSDDGRKTTEKVGEVLKKNPGLKIKIDGHCDERGTPDYNIALGGKRAGTVREYLIKLGIAADRMEITSYGSEVPVDPGHNESAWSKNRRAEFKIWDE